jgi:preprotein translocase subunit SecA
MDTRTGQIYSAEEVCRMTEEDRRYMQQMGHHPTPIQRVRGKVGRNDYCPCGSGKKFKKCCLFKENA